MTREKLKRAIALGLRRAQKPDAGSAPDCIADAIEMALELELEATSGEDAAPIEFPAVDMGGGLTDTPAQSAAPPLPRSPAVSETPRLIITPQEAAQEAAAEAAKPPTVAHHVISAPAGEDGEERAWRLEALLEKLHAVTPETIDIEVDVPERGMVPVKLSRNILAGAGFGAVKVSYKHDAADDSLAALETIMLDDCDVDITALMEKLYVSAKHAYRPRPRTIQSNTPARSGEMSFDMNSTPHAETDVLTTTSGNKY